MGSVFLEIDKVHSCWSNYLRSLVNQMCGVIQWTPVFVGNIVMCLSVEQQYNILISALEITIHAHISVMLVFPWVCVWAIITPNVLKLCSSYSHIWYTYMMSIRCTKNHEDTIAGVETRRPFLKVIVKKCHSQFREKIESTHFWKVLGTEASFADINPKLIWIKT